MAVQLHPPYAVATYMKKRTSVYNLCQELFLQFLSIRATSWIDYNTLGAIFFLFVWVGVFFSLFVGLFCCVLFVVFVYKRSLVRRTRSVQGAVSVLARQTDTSVSCCTSVVCFMGSPTALLLCSTKTSPRVLEPAACKQSGGV